MCGQPQKGLIECRDLSLAICTGCLLYKNEARAAKRVTRWRSSKHCARKKGSPNVSRTFSLPEEAQKESWRGSLGPLSEKDMLQTDWVFLQIPLSLLMALNGSFYWAVVYRGQTYQDRKDRVSRTGCDALLFEPNSNLNRFSFWRRNKTLREKLLHFRRIFSVSNHYLIPFALFLLAFGTLFSVTLTTLSPISSTF